MTATKEDSWVSSRFGSNVGKHTQEVKPCKPQSCIHTPDNNGEKKQTESIFFLNLHTTVFYRLSKLRVSLDKKNKQFTYFIY